MPIIYLDFIVNAFFILIFVNIACMIFALFMHLFVPKSMEKEFFREPYFSPQFIAISSSFPMNYYKIFMFMRLAGWPESGKKRGMPATAHEICPVWFQVVSRVFLRIFIVAFTLFIISTVILSTVVMIFDF